MKVLIIGHNPFNKELPNGRTLYELFSLFDKNDIAELFLHPDSPTFDVCNNYYRITDADMLKYGVLGKPGKKIRETDQAPVQIRNGAYKQGSKRKSYMVLLRNTLWKYGNWFTRDLKKWIEEFHPEIIFFYSGNYVFSIDIAMTISSYYNIPIVTYIVDDYYFGRDLKCGFWGGVNKKSFDKKIRSLLTGRNTICLNEYMKEKYAQEFPGDFFVLHTVSSLVPFEPVKPDGVIKMSYLGGIACERFKSLLDIGRIISQNNLPIEFTVYTRETREWLIAPLRNAPGIVLHPGLNYEEVLNTMRDSHILVHVEGFSSEAQELVKYSMSTKIADTLSSNRCLLAYGPRQVASIEYLLDNNCAMVATDLKSLEKNLIAVCLDRNILNEKTCIGVSVAYRNHRAEEAVNKLKHILKKALDDYKSIK